MAHVQAATSVIAPAAAAHLAKANAAAQRDGYRGERSQRLDIVSHSMGALSGRWYAAKLHPERVRTWIAIAGANHGTNTVCRFTDEASREMCPAFATDSQTHALQVAPNGTDGLADDEAPYDLRIVGPV